MKKELELKEKRLKHKMKRIRYTIEENNNVMSRYDHKIETSLEGIEHLSKEKKEEIERKMKEKRKIKACDSKIFQKQLFHNSKGSGRQKPSPREIPKVREDNE